MTLLKGNSGNITVTPSPDELEPQSPWPGSQGHVSCGPASTQNCEPRSCSWQRFRAALLLSCVLSFSLCLPPGKPSVSQPLGGQSLLPHRQVLSECVFRDLSALRWPSCEPSPVNNVRFPGKLRQLFVFVNTGGSTDLSYRFEYRKTHFQGPGLKFVS